MSTTIAFFARGGLHVNTCNPPGANRAVWSLMRAAVDFFLQVRDHMAIGNFFIIYNLLMSHMRFVMC